MALTELDDDQRYRALQARDARFDGVFIVGVRTTGIYCRPSCPTPIHPLRKNVDFFPTTAAAQRAGLRACKRCRPDASPGSPDWNVRDDLVGRAMRLLNQGYLDTHSVAELAGDLAVTERHLRRIMIDSVGAPPVAIARAQRAQTARTLIETTTMKFIDVAFASGFSSLRQFNDTVRAVFDASPTELRAKRGTAASEAGSLTIRLPYRSPFARRYCVDWSDRRAVAGVAAVYDGTIRTALRLPHGTGVASLRIEDQWVRCDLELDDVADLAPAVAQCRRMLDLDADPMHIDAVLAQIAQMRDAVAALPGMRSPGSPDGFATLIFAVLGQQRSVAAARTLAGRIVERARQLEAGSAASSVAGASSATGVAATSETGSVTSAIVGTSKPTPEVSPQSPQPIDTLRPFPAPDQIRDLDLDGLGLTRRTVATIHAVAERFDGSVDELTPGGDREQVRSDLLQIKGIGPWTADYVAMRALGHPDIFLGGDLVARRSANAVGLTADLIDAASPWRSYLTHHLWAAAARKDPS